MLKNQFITTCCLLNLLGGYGRWLKCSPANPGSNADHIGTYSASRLFRGVKYVIYFLNKSRLSPISFQIIYCHNFRDFPFFTFHINMNLRGRFHGENCEQYLIYLFLIY